VLAGCAVELRTDIVSARVLDNPAVLPIAPGMNSTPVPHPFPEIQALCDRQQALHTDMMRGGMSFEELQDLVNNPRPAAETEKLLQEAQALAVKLGLRPEEQDERRRHTDAWLETPRSKLSALVRRIAETAVLTVEFAPVRSFRDWIESPDAPVRFRGLDSYSEQWIAGQISGRWFKLDCLQWPASLDLAEANSAAELGIALTATVRHWTEHPEDAGLTKRFWNTARRFNPEKLLTLKLKGLQWNPVLKNEPCTVLLDGVEEEAALPEERFDYGGDPVLPCHPTLQVPWRVIQHRPDGALWEESLHDDKEEAEKRAAGEIASMKKWLRVNIPKKCPEHLQEKEFQEWAEKRRKDFSTDYRVVRDSPDLPVIGSNGLAAEITPCGLKAREIWFQRYREVIGPGLPPARRSLLFLRETRLPCHPLRTFAAQIQEDAAFKRPVCAGCGQPCGIAVHLNLTHHRLPFRVPAASLLLYTCTEHNAQAECWHGAWLDREKAVRHNMKILKQATACESGVPVWVTEYENDKVDKEAFDRNAPAWPRFSDSREKDYDMFAFKGTKLGGAPGWVQSPRVPKDRNHQRMEFLAQISSTEFLEMADSGILYLFYSPETGETSKVVQFY